jgi:hypothetical protein
MPYRLLAAAIAVMLFGAGCYAFGVSVEEGREAKREVQRREDARVFEAENRRLERKWYDKTAGAVNESRKREQIVHEAAAGARGELDGLRNDLSASSAGLPSATLDACRSRVSALSAVFEQCATKYQGVAEQADAHSSDSLMLQQAWPLAGQ